MSENILRKFIREEIGRNFHTVSPTPYTFEDFSDYNIEINGSTEGGFYLRVEFEGKEIATVQLYRNYEEAKHASRMIVDNDRVKRMNSLEKEKE